MALTGGSYNTGGPTGGTGTGSLMGYKMPKPQAAAPAGPAAPMGAPMPASARAPVAPSGGGGFAAQQGSYGSTPGGYGGPPQPATTQMNMPQYQAPPPPQNYQQYQPQSSPVAGDLRELSGRGSDLMDPNSDYYKELVSQMRGDIGQSTAAAKRSAALAGAEQGFGAGASPEMLSMMGDIGEAGRIAEGNAMGDLSLAAPQVGAGMMASTFGTGAQLQGIGEQSGQFGAGLRESGTMNRAGMAEGARQFGTNVGLQQQGMADARAAREAEMRTQQQQWESEFGPREDAMAAEYGAYGPAQDEYGAGAVAAAGMGGIGY